MVGMEDIGENMAMVHSKVSYYAEKWTKLALNQTDLMGLN